jgi:hypothetical protein
VPRPFQLLPDPHRTRDERQDFVELGMKAALQATLFALANRFSRSCVASGTRMVSVPMSCLPDNVLRPQNFQLSETHVAPDELLQIQPVPERGSDCLELGGRNGANPVVQVIERQAHGFVDHHVRGLRESILRRGIDPNLQPRVDQARGQQTQNTGRRASAIWPSGEVGPGVTAARPQLGKRVGGDSRGVDLDHSGIISPRR